MASPKWKCTSCAFENESSADLCAMCHMRQENPEETLPKGWRSAIANDGKIYYQNDIKRRTTWTKPIIQPQRAHIETDSDSASDHERKLENKENMSQPSIEFIEINAAVPMQSKNTPQKWKCPSCAFDNDSSTVLCATCNLAKQIPEPNYVQNSAKTLPLSWKECVTPERRIYYQNDVTKQTSWTKPVNDGVITTGTTTAQSASIIRSNPNNSEQSSSWSRKRKLKFAFAVFLMLFGIYDYITDIIVAIWFNTLIACYLEEDSTVCSNRDEMNSSSSWNSLDATVCAIFVFCCATVGFCFGIYNSVHKLTFYIKLAKNKMSRKDVFNTRFYHNIRIGWIPVLMENVLTTFVITIIGPSWNIQQTGEYVSWQIGQSMVTSVASICLKSFVFFRNIYLFKKINNVKTIYNGPDKLSKNGTDCWKCTYGCIALLLFWFFIFIFVVSLSGSETIGAIEASMVRMGEEKLCFFPKDYSMTNDSTITEVSRKPAYVKGLYGDYDSGELFDFTVECSHGYFLLDYDWRKVTATIQCFLDYDLLNASSSDWYNYNRYSGVSYAHYCEFEMQYNVCDDNYIIPCEFYEGNATFKFCWQRIICD